MGRGESASELLVGRGKHTTVARARSEKPHGVKMEEFRGVFQDGYTEEDIDHLIPQMEERLGFEMRVVWESVDDYGFGGDSTLLVLKDGEFYNTPPELDSLLYDAEGGGWVDPSDITPNEFVSMFAPEFVSPGLRNWASKDLRED